MYVCSAAEKAADYKYPRYPQKYSDKNHRLSQKDIIEILDKEYCMKIDRKTVKRNLIEFGYAIEYSESIRLVKDKNGEEVESKAEKAKEPGSVLSSVFSYLLTF